MNSGFLADMKRQLGEHSETAREIAAALTDSQRNWRPAEGKWSVAECLDHMAVTNNIYLDNMEPAMESGRAQGKTADGSDRTKISLFARFLFVVLKSGRKRKVKAPAPFAPRSEIGADVLDVFLASQERLAKAIEASDKLDINRIRLATPVSSFITLTLGDAIDVLVVHTGRHLEQIREVMASPEFPAAD